MAKTLGDMLNAAGKERGDPEITAIDSSNIFQARMIEVANNAGRELTDRVPYKWRYKRATLVTTADITAGSAAVTNANATVTSVDSNGANATNWGSATTSMFFRATATRKSYQVTAVSNSGSPHTLTLEQNYLDSTSTATGYRLFQDTYSISTSDFDELRIASYGDTITWVDGLSGRIPRGELHITDIEGLMNMAGGDRHRDTSGRPAVIAQIGVDSSDNPQFVLWPFPTEQWLIELWYIATYTAATAFTTTLFAADAPPSAYDFVEHKVVAAAHRWDQNFDAAAVSEQEAQNALINVVRRENRENIDAGFDVETYRRQYGVHYPGRSGVLFDTVLRRRR